MTGHRTAAATPGGKAKEKTNMRKGWAGWNRSVIILYTVTTTPVMMGC